MPEVIIYTDIKEKKKSNGEGNKLSDREALIRALDLLDFYATLTSKNEKLPQQEEYGSIPWIDLAFTSNDRK